MYQFLKTILLLIISVALTFPLALSNKHWYIATFISIISILAFIYSLLHTKKSSIAFLSSIIIGAFFSISFWILSYIDTILYLRHDLYFLAAFTLFFILVSLCILYIRPNLIKKVSLILINIAALSIFIYLIVSIQNYHETIGLAIFMGGLIGLMLGSICILIFRYIINICLDTFNNLSDYISLLLKPFFIFFTGYLLIALIFSGIYNLIYMCNPESLSFPGDQIRFLDLIIYATDSMTTGGNSIVSARSILAQFVNTANVFSAIIWMTVILAATIAHTSESFSEIRKKHNKMANQANEDNQDNDPSII